MVFILVSSNERTLPDHTFNKCARLARKSSGRADIWVSDNEIMIQQINQTSQRWMTEDDSRSLSDSSSSPSSSSSLLSHPLTRLTSPSNTLSLSLSPLRRHVSLPLPLTPLPSPPPCLISAGCDYPGLADQKGEIADCALIIDAL